MLKSVLSPFAEPVYGAIRIVTGLMFSFHGMQKILGVLRPYPAPVLWSQMWFGGMIELIAGLLIAIGLFTRCAAFVASGTMAVAYWQFHVFGNKEVHGISQFIPGANNGTPAVLYCFLFLYFACKGAGMWSIDAKREKAANAS
jgi:putative oxidoreductase